MRFSTLVHKFAQNFSEIYIDAAKSWIYLAHQIEPEVRLNGSEQRPRFLTDIAVPERTGKSNDSQYSERLRKLNRDCSKMPYMEAQRE